MRFSIEQGSQPPDCSLPTRRLSDCSPIFLGALVCGNAGAVLNFYLDQLAMGYNAAAPFLVIPKSEIYGDRFDHTPLVLQSTDQNISKAELKLLVAEQLVAQEDVTIDEKEMFLKLAGITIFHPLMHVVSGG